MEVDEQFGTLEVARGDADVVLGVGVVELGESPVDQAELGAQSVGSVEKPLNCQRWNRSPVGENGNASIERAPDSPAASHDQS